MQLVVKVKIKITIFLSIKSPQMEIWLASKLVGYFSAVILPKIFIHTAWLMTIFDHFISNIRVLLSLQF